MQLREPVPQDAAVLGRIHVETWQAAYRGMMPDAYLDGLSVDDRVALWEKWLAEPPSPGRTRLVVEDDDGVVGFILTGPEDGDPDARVGEVYALNVAPAAWGRGAGMALLGAGVAALARHGFDESVLWVHPQNRRARSFYEQAGWTCDGTTRDQQVLGVEVAEIRYRRTATS